MNNPDPPTFLAQQWIDETDLTIHPDNFTAQARIITKAQASQPLSRSSDVAIQQLERVLDILDKRPDLEMELRLLWGQPSALHRRRCGAEIDELREIADFSMVNYDRELFSNQLWDAGVARALPP